MKGKVFDDKVRELDELLGVGRCFDMIGRTLRIGKNRAKLWVVNGYAVDEMLERMISVWLPIPSLRDVPDLQAFTERYVSAADSKTETDWDAAVTAVFAGRTLLIIEGYDGGILMDAKHYPDRNVDEPDSSKVLRGSHDGFVENIMCNAALLRRRIRDPRLTLERHQVSERSRTDVALCYMKGLADEELLRDLRQKLDHIEARSIAMGQESIAESIAPRQWYNPFPKVRYIERPDVATACIMEGDVLLMVDNSPALMVLPVTLFRFVEEINDYYFPPLVGTYLQLVRLVVVLLTIFITPLWYLLVKEPGRAVGMLGFIAIGEDYFVPLIVQLFLVELIIDVLKLASLNTPNVFSNSFSVLGALILGDFAVQSRWLVPEVLVYMAFVAIANYAQHSYEMGYAFKLCRMALLLLVWALDWWGFAIGTVGIAVLIATTKPIGNKGYLYPLIPFNGKALARLLHREHISKYNT
ncbi:MAG: spore germination protein [Clostridiales bacterium]|nr:spore germination protein [Candidatus Cacconaster stercorequi]